MGVADLQTISSFSETVFGHPSRWGCKSLAALSTVLCLLGVPLASSVGAAEKGAPGSNYQAESTVYKQCKEAEELLGSARFSQALSVLQAAAANDPNSYSQYVHLSMARAYRGEKDYSNAASEAEKALQFNGQSADALYTAALIYEDAKDYGRAIKYLEKSCGVTRDETFKSRARALLSEIKAYKNLQDAQTCIDRGRDSEAKSLLEKAASYDPSKVSGSVHSSLAYVLRRMGKCERAIDEGKKSLTYDANAPDTLYTIGIAYQDIGEFEEAITWLRRYVAAEPDGERRRRANEFCRELQDDLVKLDPAANSKPDYLEQLKAKHDVYPWPRARLPIRFYIAPGTGVYGYRPIFRTFVIRALDTWYEASGNKTSYTIVTDPKLADVKVKFTPDEISMGESKRIRQKAGLTTFDTNDGSGRCLVKIRTVCPFDPGQLVQDGQCATVCMHEIGHSLGLGHSTYCRDLMYFGASSQEPGTPSSRDKSTIKRLYAGYPVASVATANKPVVGSEPIRYLPPPMFLPPKSSDTTKLPPPLFVPPPIKTEKEKLQPPLFIPPPKNADSGKMPAKLTPPSFLPPPLKKQVRAQSGSSPPPLFMPPPK